MTESLVETARVEKASLPADYLWLLLVTFLFGLSNGISHGRWQPIACVLLVLTLSVLGWRFFVTARAAQPVGAQFGIRAVFALLLSMPITALVDPTVLAQPVHSMLMVRVAEVCSILLIASYAPFLGGRPEPERLRTARFVAFGIVLLVAGIAVIHITPSPGIDVWTIQMRGADVLLHGKNPYVWATVPDTDPESDFTVPFVYPPAAVYCATLGAALFGDVRYVLLGTMFVAGLALRFIAVRASSRAGVQFPSLIVDAPALFFWQTPLLLMVVELSWLDPLQIMLISLGVAAYVADRRTLAAVVLGFAVSSKQSMFWLFPLVGVVLRFDFKRWAVMSVAALLPVLPFMIWDFAALKHANFDFMAGLKPRRDALCFTNAVWKMTRASFPPASAFLLAAATVGEACRRVLLRRGRAASATSALPTLDFSRALVLTYFVFFFFNRWAFANYYFLLTGLSALAGAAALHDGARVARGETARGPAADSPALPLLAREN